MDARVMNLKERTVRGERLSIGTRNAYQTRIEDLETRLAAERADGWRLAAEALDRYVTACAAAVGVPQSDLFHEVTRLRAEVERLLADNRQFARIMHAENVQKRASEEASRVSA